MESVSGVGVLDKAVTILHAVAVSLLLGVGALPHDNCVIDDNAQGDYKTENTQQIQAGINHRGADNRHGT